MAEKKIEKKQKNTALAKAERNADTATAVPEPSSQKDDESFPKWLENWNTLKEVGNVDVLRDATLAEIATKKTAEAKEESKKTKVEKELVASFRGKKKIKVKNVMLYKLNFLGEKFRAGSGVSKEFGRILKKAQVKIYKQYIDGGGEDNKEKFKEWADIQDKHIGYRKDEVSHHNKGKAIDINYYGNPWIPTRNGKTCRGEKHTSKNKQGEGISLKFNQNIWKNALKAYDNAITFVYDETESADLSKRNDSESHSDVFKRFCRVSRATAVYFSMIYESLPADDKENNLLTPKKNKEHKPQNEESFLGNIINAWDNSHCPCGGIKKKYPGFSDWACDNQYKLTQDYIDNFLDYEYENPENVITESGDYEFTGDPEDLVHPCLYYLVRTVYPQIITDHDALRWAMVIGKIRSSDESAKTLSLASRDPCWGFINIKKEIAIGLMDVMHENSAVAKKDPHNHSRDRWGGCDFNVNDNGDTMHFDIGNTPIK